MSPHWSSRFEHYFIDKDALGSDVAQRVLRCIVPEKISYLEPGGVTKNLGTLSPKEFSQSKRLLHLKNFRGSFFKRCPGSRPGLTCCNYFVLNLGQQCDMNCSYCYLQSFINSPKTVIYTNVLQALEELREFSVAGKNQNFRIGTGEVIDSLSLDDLTLYSRVLIEFIQEFPNWRVEFKTKSDKVDQFLDLGGKNTSNVIVSWSINPEHIVSAEEHATASTQARLAAAEKCKNRGFSIALHIDPVIWHPDWKKNYAGIVEQITSKFHPEDMPYISLGALRFQPEQQQMMKERFGMKSYVTSGEMFTGKDGKLRYDNELRQKMFKFIIDQFHQKSPHWKIFLCMESPESWLNSMNAMPRSTEGLENLFDHAPVRTFRKYQKA